MCHGSAIHPLPLTPRTRGFGLVANSEKVKFSLFIIIFFNW